MVADIGNRSHHYFTDEFRPSQISLLFNLDLAGLLKIDKGPIQQ